MRAYLLETAVRLEQLIEDFPGTPENAAKLVPKALGYTGEAIKAERDQLRAVKFAALFALKRAMPGLKRSDVKDIASDLAKKAGVSTSRLYRWAAPANIRELVKFLSSGRRAK